MQRINAIIYVVDDDPVIGKSMQRVLKTEGLDSEMFTSADDFLRIGKKYKYPSCLVLDVNMPGLSGFDLQKELNNRGLGMPIIFVTGYGDIPMSVRAMKNGAVDFLQKPFHHHDLMEAIHKGIDLSSKFQKGAKEKQQIQKLVDTLTERERDVFCYVITGLLNKQIGVHLGISEKTVKVHRGRLMRKLGVCSVAELVVLSQKVGVEPAKI